MKGSMKHYLNALVAVILLTLATTSCWTPQTEISCSQFIFETIGPCYLSVNEYRAVSGTLSEAEMLKPRRFRCRIVDGRIENIDHLTFTGSAYWVGWFWGPEVGDTTYYRRIPVVRPEDVYTKKKYTKYYIPDRPLYWEFQEISIVSNNASFGADYPVGSDLTPIVTFGFPSLLEFIQNGYKGDYTTEHLIRANDQEAWANLKIFETGKPKLIIDRLPTEVVGGGMPMITIRLKFIDKGGILKNKQISWDKYMEVRDDIKPYPEEYDLPITLQLDIQ